MNWCDYTPAPCRPVAGLPPTRLGAEAGGVSSFAQSSAHNSQGKVVCLPAVPLPALPRGGCGVPVPAINYQLTSSPRPN